MIKSDGTLATVYVDDSFKLVSVQTGGPGGGPGGPHGFGGPPPSSSSSSSRVPARSRNPSGQIASAPV